VSIISTSGKRFRKCNKEVKQKTEDRGWGNVTHNTT